jgi:lycopene beta-cyclase
MQSHVILVGAGLANCLIAWRIAQTRDDVQVTLLERGAEVGGNHTWSFHVTDVSDEAMAWLKPFIAYSWPAYDVEFPKLKRRFNGGYASIPSDRLRDLLEAEQKLKIIKNVDVIDLKPTSVTLADNRRMEADCVIDGRGVRKSPHLTLGYQKFVGKEVLLKEPHGLTCPILMDATVAQEDGYRFLYVLPLGPRELLVEDTRYADGAVLNDDEILAALDVYLRSRGWIVERDIREERGVLPIVLTGDLPNFWADGAPGVPRSGLAAALFNPATGYSLPEAVRLADEIAQLASFDAQHVYNLTKAASENAWQRGGLFRLVNRMLFRAADPSRRWVPLQRFHTLPDGLVSRFYAGFPTFGDKVRILVGKPPVPFFRALRCIDDRHPAEHRKGT